ncbi:MAG TPA: hypothetical protein VIM02_13755 [Rhizomicrobium sp.]|jgi:hypothetical protein
MLLLPPEREGGYLKHGFLLPHGDFDQIQHVVHARHDVAGPETHNPKAIALKPSCPTRVMNRLLWLRVLVAVNFYNQSHGEADEVGKIRAYRVLPPEAMTVDILSPEESPRP